MELIVDLGIIFMAAATLGLLVKILRLPLIIAYLLAGIILGSGFLGIITDPQVVENLSALGIALMLFLVGMELNWNRIKDFSKTALLVGAGQIIITGAIGYVLALALKFPPVASLYLSLGLTFSSTIVVIKLLGDKRDLNSLYGKIAIGVLLVQDIIAILALIFLQGLSEVQAAGLLITGLWTISKALLLFGLVAIFKNYFLPGVFKIMARSTELLMLAGLGWAFAIALASYFLGFGLEIGAFLAGLSIASLPYSLEISSQVKSLRDFFVTLFFVTLGLNLTLNLSQLDVGQIVFWSLFVLIGQLLITMIIMGLIGFRRRTSFQTAIALSQVSEFSFILASLGVQRGDISPLLSSEIIIIGMITIIFSTILIEQSDNIYPWLAKYLKIFERSQSSLKNDKIKLPGYLDNHVILFGADHIGKRVLESLAQTRHKMLVVDFNPDIIKKLQEEDFPAIYGDMGDPEFINALGLERAAMVISTTHDFHDNLALVKKLNVINKNSIIYVMANTPEEAIDLYRAGAERVVLPANLTSDLFNELIKGFNRGKRFNIQKHMKELKQQQKKYYQ